MSYRDLLAEAQARKLAEQRLSRIAFITSERIKDAEKHGVPLPEDSFLRLIHHIATVEP